VRDLLLTASSVHRGALPDLSRADLAKLVEDNTGIPGRLVRLPLTYWVV
jgi:hypothetical protein